MAVRSASDAIRIWCWLPWMPLCEIQASSQKSLEFWLTVPEGGANGSRGPSDRLTSGSGWLQPCSEGGGGSHCERERAASRSTSFRVLYSTPPHKSPPSQPYTDTCTQSFTILGCTLEKAWWNISEFFIKGKYQSLAALFNQKTTLWTSCQK